MKPVLLAAIILAVATPAVFASDYEVIVDGKAYLFSDGVEKQVAAKDGKYVSITVSAVKFKTFQEHGISFRYPNDMKLKQESFLGIKQVTLESTVKTQQTVATS